jgi:hypothetical protein
MKTQLFCGVSSRAYNVKKILKDFDQLPRSAEYFTTIYGPDIYDIYLTTGGQYYARLITY